MGQVIVPSACLAAMPPLVAASLGAGVPPQPLRTGGHAETGAFGPVGILVNGDATAGGALDLRLDSADLDGDGFVNLGDGGLVAQDLVPGYAYRSDFVGDGVINVSDAGLMARALGARRP